MHTISGWFVTMVLLRNHLIFKSKLHYNMNDIFDNSFYKEKLAIANKTTFLKKLERDIQNIK